MRAAHLFWISAAIGGALVAVAHHHWVEAFWAAAFASSILTLRREPK